ncbi:MAG: N-acetyltransferase, partial [Candidatus Brocadiia bacterium]
MFRIRRIFDDVLPANRHALESVQNILRIQFYGLSQSKIDRIPDLLRNPFVYDFRSILYIAEEPSSSKVKGFALLCHDPKLRFCYLDYLATEKHTIGRGIGGALYERVREEAALLKVTGLFFECLPDDPALCKNPDILKLNKTRLRFYETFGARPIANTAYETPVNPQGDNAPYLVFDDLSQQVTLSRDYVRQIVKSILNRKY